MNKDLAFFGFLGSLVSSLFIYIATIEIPFYARWEVHVRVLAVICLLLCLGVIGIASMLRSDRG